MKEIIIISKNMAGVTFRPYRGKLSSIAIFFVFLLTVPVCYAADVTLTWDANPDPAVTGYRVYYGTSTRYYTNAVDAGNQTAFTITGLLPGVTYFFAATDYSDEGYESYFSSEISYTVSGSSSSESSGGGGCFIATAAYGSSLSPEVSILREFRDRVLLKHALGESFVEWYSRVSPPAAAFIADHESLKLAARMGLAPVVYAVKHPLSTLFVMVSIPLFVIALCKKTRRKR